jgi:hypothetical protein
MGAASLDPRSEAFQALRKLGVPGVIVTLNRMGFGVASILARLEATRNWHSIVHEFWEGRPSETQLGKEEEVWMAKTHPDFVPPFLPR